MFPSILKAAELERKPELDLTGFLSRTRSETVLWLLQHGANGLRMGVGVSARDVRTWKDTMRKKPAALDSTLR